MPKGQFLRSDEHRKHISEALKGRVKDPEHIRKIADAKRGGHIDPEKRERMAERMRENPPSRGLKWTDEQKAAKSIAQKGRTHLLAKYGVSSDEYAAKISEGLAWCHHGRHFVQKDIVNRTGTCRDCKSDYNRKSDLKRKFGLSPEQYTELVEGQGGGCAICNRTATTKNLAVDHDHVTGKTRGILCTRCNTALAILEEVPDWYIRAAKYLAKYQ